MSLLISLSPRPSKVTHSMCQYCPHLLQSICQQSMSPLQGHLRWFHSDRQSGDSAGDSISICRLSDLTLLAELEFNLPLGFLKVLGLWFWDLLRPGELLVEPPLAVLDLEGWVSGDGVCRGLLLLFLLLFIVPATVITNRQIQGHFPLIFWLIRVRLPLIVYCAPAQRRIQRWDDWSGPINMG